MNRWLLQASRFAKSKADRTLAIRNAKMQISYWGPDHPQTDLQDYAHKEWCGLLSSLYVQRWRAFREDMLRVMQGRAASTDYFQMEKRWAEDASFISAPKMSPQQLSDLLERITGISSLEHETR